jgi:tetratricopeptide (TPR) repeat protein
MDKNLLRHIYKPSPCLGKDEVNAYLSGRLSGENLRRVENHLLDCPLCSDAVEGFESAAVPAGEEVEDFSSFKKKLELSSGGNIRHLTPYHTLRRSIAVAAVFALAVVAYWSFFHSPEGSELYKQYYTAYENDIPLNLRSSDSAQLLNLAFVQALNNYSQGQFSTSVSLFEEVLNTEPDNIPARFFAGLAYLETNQPDKAAECFTAVSGKRGNYSRQAAWYLILTHLKKNEKEEAKTLLDRFKQTGGYKSKEAAELKAKL